MKTTAANERFHASGGVCAGDSAAGQRGKELKTKHKTYRK